MDHNQDWFITHGGDGFESQVDPKIQISYTHSLSMDGSKVCKKSGEEVGIKPIARKGE